MECDWIRNHYLKLKGLSRVYLTVTGSKRLFICRMSYFVFRMLYFVCLMSYVLCLMSYVLCLMSYCSFGASCLMKVNRRYPLYATLPFPPPPKFDAMIPTINNWSNFNINNTLGLIIFHLRIVLKWQLNKCGFRLK